MTTKIDLLQWYMEKSFPLASQQFEASPGDETGDDEPEFSNTNSDDYDSSVYEQSISPPLNKGKGKGKRMEAEELVEVTALPKTANQGGESTPMGSDSGETSEPRLTGIKRSLSPVRTQRLRFKRDNKGNIDFCFSDTEVEDEA